MHDNLWIGLFVFCVLMCLLGGGANAGAEREKGNDQKSEQVNLKPVDDATFGQIADHFQYDRDRPLNAVSYGSWKWLGSYMIEKIRYESVRGAEVPGYFSYPIAEPEGTEADSSKGMKFPAILLVHSWNSFWGKDGDWARQWMDIIVRTGRCVLLVDNPGFGERSDPVVEGGWKSAPYTKRDWIVQCVIDQRRGVDYLLTRPEVDPDRIGIMGGSMGGSIGVIVAALDDRFKVAIFTVTSAWTKGARDDPMGRFHHTLNFAPRIAAPVLMVNATGDGRERGEILYEAMPEPKLQVWYESGHWLPPRESSKEVLEWLDKYLK